jgi:hypothetical protein
MNLGSDPGFPVGGERAATSEPWSKSQAGCLVAWVSQVTAAHEPARYPQTVWLGTARSGGVSETIPREVL